MIIRLLNGATAGISVLDLTSSMGAFCGKLLRDLGMDVIKVEPPGGDPTRSEPPFAKGHAHPRGQSSFCLPQRGQAQHHAGYHQNSGRELLLDLVEARRHRAGKLSSRAISRAQISATKSDLSGRNTNSSWLPSPASAKTGPTLTTRRRISSARRWEDCSTSAATRRLHPAIRRKRNPIIMPVSSPPTERCLALWQRETRGIGAYVDASIQASMALHEHVAFNYSAEGRVMKRAGSQHQHNAPANLFQCKNGWIALFVTQTHWPLLLKVWEDHAPELDDPKWINSNLRRAHADYINAQVTSFTSRFLKEDLAELMQKHGIPGLPVNSPLDFMKDPHIQARGFFGTVTHPVLGSFEQPGSPFMVDGQRAAPSPAPLLGQHNRGVFCGELGLEPKELAVLADGWCDVKEHLKYQFDESP